MSQLSFFSAESVPPEVTDLAGLLAGPGQVMVSGSGARISVVVAQPWRALALAEMITETGLQAEMSHTDENHPLVRTAIDPTVLPIAHEWTRGAVKTVPAQWLPGARELRAWVLAAGSPEADRYLLGLDPHAPGSHCAGTVFTAPRVHSWAIGSTVGSMAVRTSGWFSSVWLISA